MFKPITLELLLRREAGSFIEFPATDATPARVYHFKPTDGSPTAPHICVIDIQQHAERLLGIDGYRIFGQAEIPRPPVVEPPPETPAIVTTPSLDVEKVTATRELSVSALKSSINTIPDDVLREALTQEKADEKPRSSWIAVVEAHLGA